MTLKEAPAAVRPEGLLQPCWAEITDIDRESHDTSTFWIRLLDPEVRSAYRFMPGQFNMVYVPGYGEAAISLSSDPADSERVGHTVRFVGNVTRALSRLRPGDKLGIRGPFGRGWPQDACERRDIVIASGGIGIAPLRPMLYEIINNRDQYRDVTVLYGSRSPADLLYTEEFEAWEAADIEMIVTVDRADESWLGQVGVVPMLFYRLRLDSQETVVLTCGPEIMMRFVVFEALARRVPTDRIFLSMERNMKCGHAHCGHCQLGPYFVCKDGPVQTYAELEPFFHVEGL